MNRIEDEVFLIRQSKQQTYKDKLPLLFTKELKKRKKRKLPGKNVRKIKQYDNQYETSKKRLDQDWKEMKHKFVGTIQAEERMEKQIEHEIENIRKTIPIDFLRSLKVEDYLMERGVETINKIMIRMTHVKVSQAFLRWIEFSEYRAAEIVRERMENASKASGINLFNKIILRVQHVALNKSWKKWKDRIFIQERELEDLASSIQIQRIARGKLGRIQWQRMKKMKNDMAACVIQRAIRAFFC